MTIGVLRLEIYLPFAGSLKDKRSALKSLKDRLRGKFNVAVAEVEPDEKWQRAWLGVSTVGTDRRFVDSYLSQVVEWVRATGTAELIRVEQELL
jgi:uncharacterized protein YlxP (DUF503 family)